MTTISSPSFCSVDTWRDVVKNNAALSFICFSITTDETWLPKVLTDAGFFTSGSQVKKNRPDLWRDILPVFDEVEVTWASIFVYDGSSGDA